MGVDAERFHPRRKTAEVRRELLARAAASENATLLLYAGRLAPEKNLPLLLDLLTILSTHRGEYRLLIAGDGPLRKEFLRECGQRHPGRVAYLGHIPDRHQLADVMANADVFVHPNPNEPFGIAPLEAMAAGTPLLAPDSGGVRNYANADNAWIVPATAGAFALAVLSIIHDDQDRERRTARARAAAESLDWPQVCAGFLSLYRELYARTREPEAAGIEEPAFYSTPGNWLGWETPRRDSGAEAGARSSPG
jgi:alpha-1,6-mannosyltransferase